MARQDGLFLLILLAPTLPASAIELSLEENRAQRGNIGYVDMQRIFKTFPETMRAKENFEELVRQTEEQINVRKADVLRLRREFSELKIEREFLAKNALLVSTAASSAGTAAVAATQISTAAIASAKTPEPLIINIPGVTKAPIIVKPPEISTIAASIPLMMTATTAMSTAPAALAALPTSINSPLAEIDAKIALKAVAVAQKENSFKEYETAAEKDLLDIENRKSELLLGRIRKAIQEVALQESISVVVDKKTLIFGHETVNLTEKVLKRLKES